MSCLGGLRCAMLPPTPRDSVSRHVALCRGVPCVDSAALAQCQASPYTYHVKEESLCHVAASTCLKKVYTRTVSNLCHVGRPPSGADCFGAQWSQYLNLTSVAQAGRLHARLKESLGVSDDHVVAVKDALESSPNRWWSIGTVLEALDKVLTDSNEHAELSLHSLGQIFHEQWSHHEAIAHIWVGIDM